MSCHREILAKILHKPLSSTALNTVFKQVFGEALAPHGFVKIKGKQPYFVRIVKGAEIIHVITCGQRPSSNTIYKEFCIYGGIATVYRQRIDLDIKPERNFNWLNHIRELYTWSNPFDYDNEFRKSIYTFSYKVDDDESMINSVEYSLKLTEDIILPVLDEVTNLDSCIEYFSKFHADMLSIYDEEDFGYKYNSGFYNEGLLYIKINNNDDFIEKAKKELAIITYNIKMGREFISHEKASQIIEEGRLLQVTRRDNIYNNAELYAKALEELKCRKTANTETLRSYGLSL